MEMNEKNGFELGNGGYHLSYHASGFPLEGYPSAQASHPSSSDIGSALMNSSPRNLVLRENNPLNPNGAPSCLDVGWNPSYSLPKDGSIAVQHASGFLQPSNFCHIPADAGFIERAARYSYYSGGGGGSGGGALNSFIGSGHLNVARSVLDVKKTDPVALEGGADALLQTKEQIEMVDTSAASALNHEQLGPDSSDGITCSKRRKRPCQNNETSQLMNAEQSPAEMARDNAMAEQNASESKPSVGKETKESPDISKQEYIHIRARRGQATNSHSLAERLRREKISERMKVLQDLVPGCSKVTGKAVMLDEIINYVQSLQRQVEFLSMKLATVNPRLDLNIEELLTKDSFHAHGHLPFSPGFLPNAAHHTQLHPTQLAHVGGIPSSIMNAQDAILRTINVQLPTNDGYNEATSQVHDIWDGDIHNVAHARYRHGTSQPCTDKPWDGFSK